MSVPTTVTLKPQQYEAARWGEHDNPAHFTFGNDHMALWLGSFYAGINADGFLKVRTVDGMVRVERGDWIIKRGPADFTVVRAVIFERDYVLVQDQHRFSQTVPNARG